MIFALIGVIILNILIAILLWASCVVAGNSDRVSEQLLKDKGEKRHAKSETD